ncbi:MAG: transcriptional regulator [Rhizobiaceae bacterium]|nr:MAG: transcriptional regulator [Rhizobiaceae bacterium]CAG0950207.1 Dimethlysulfonioproprionate lyase DddQ [Rhizobiaceae bacterium]
MSAATHDLLGLFRAFLAGRDDALVDGFAAAIGAAPAERALAPVSLPCLEYLPRAAAIAGGGAKPLAQCLARHAADLRWAQTYSEADFGRDFLDRYGWTELVGTRGHFASDTIAAGFLLLGPHVVYPDHHHIAEEIYVPLTPLAEWRKGDGAFVRRGPGEVIHHPSNVGHAMRTGAEPLLALYLWRGGPLAQKSTLTGASTVREA